MNEIFKNVETLVRIMAMSRSPCVEEWNEEALMKALKWTRYFEQVYRKIKTKDQYLQQLQERINSCVGEHKLFLGFSKFCVKDLESAKQILIRNLIQNKKVPAPLFNIITREFANTNGEFSKEEFSTNLKSLVVEKQIVWPLIGSPTHSDGSGFQRELKSMPVGWKEKQGLCNQREEMTDWSDPAFKVRCLAAARLLKKCIEQQISSAQESHPIYKVIRDKLNSLSMSLGGQMMILCSLALSTAGGCHGTEEGHISDFNSKYEVFIMNYIKEVLASKWQQDCKLFLQLPPVFLGEFSAVNNDFLKIYVENLVVAFKKTVDLEYEENICLLVRLKAGMTSEVPVLLESIKQHLTTLKDTKGIELGNWPNLYDDIFSKEFNVHLSSGNEIRLKWEQFVHETTIASAQDVLCRSEAARPF